MFDKNSKILLTVTIGGKLGATVSNKSTKEVVSRVKTSPFERQIIDGKGVPTGHYLTPKGHYLASNDFTARSTQKCTRSVNINGDAILLFASDNCPFSVKKHIWSNMDAEKRILFHLSQIAEGNPFTYEIVE